MTTIVDGKGRLLNHVELVYRPGERQLVAKVFEVLGCGVIETGGTYLVIPVVKGSNDMSNNVFYASEVTPEQWRFEQELQKQFRAESSLAAAYRSFDTRMVREPQRTTHFGVRFPTVKMLDATLDRIMKLDDPALKGRLKVSGVFRPGDPGSITNTLIQAFVKTDVFAAGFITLGQHIELQAVPGT